MGNGEVYYDGTGGTNGTQDITTIASGASLSIDGTGGFYGKTDTSYNHLALATNNGTFSLSGNMTTPGGFTNNGTVDVLSGSLTVSGAFHNVDNSGNLTGNWYLGGSVSYDGSGGINGTQDIATITSGASLTLDGSAGGGEGFFGKTDPSHNHLASLAVNNGALTLYDGATLTTSSDFTNSGTLSLSPAAFGGYGDALTTAGGFTNNGSVTILSASYSSSSGTVTVGGAFHNVDGSGNLTGDWVLAGDVYYDGSGGINGTQDITTIARGASLTLDATAALSGGSNPGLFGKTDPSHNHLAPLAAVNGTFGLENGATFTTAGDFTNNGTVTLLDTNDVGSSGTLTVGGTFHNVDNSGNLTGTWVLGGNLYYDGTGGVDGTQDITTIARGASLTLDATDAMLFGTGSPGIFGKTNPSLNHLAPLAVNNGILNLVNGASFTTIGGFTNNGTISLLDTEVTGFSGTLTVSGTFHNVDNLGNLNGDWVLGGDVYYDGSGGINGSQDITAIVKGASLTLDGTDSTTVAGFFGKTNPSHNHLALTTNNGTFRLQNTATYTTPGDFTNNGTVEIQSTVLNYAFPPYVASKYPRPTSSLTVGGTLHNVDNSGNLTGKWVLDGRVYYDGSGGVDGTQDITTIAGGASLTLDGTDSALFGSSAPGFYGKTNSSLNHLSPLALNNGTFVLQNGATFATAGDFTNNGTVNVLSAVLNFGSPPYVTTQTLTSSLTVDGTFHNVDNSGNLNGKWVLSGDVYYDGSGGVNGKQDITTIASGASLILDGTDGTTGGFFGKTDTSHNHLALATNKGTFGLQNGATFTTPGSFTTSGTLTVGNGSTFVLGGAALTNSGMLELSGNALLQGSSGTQTLTSSGTIEGAGNVGDAMMGVVSTGSILADQSTPLVINPNSAGFTNRGNLVVNAGSTLDITGPANSFLNFNSSTGTLTGGDYAVLGTLQFDNANIVNNAADITLLGANSQIVNQSNANALANFATNAAGGIFTLAGGRNFTTGGNFTNNGGLVVDTGSEFTVDLSHSLTNFSGTPLTGGTYRLYGGTLQFNGANIVTNAANITLSGTTSEIINGSGHNALTNFATNAAMASFILQGGQDLTTNAASFTNNGYLGLGTGSTFTVGTGSYTQNASGLRDIAITATTRGTTYGALDVTGTATLDGALDISLIGSGSLLTVGESFDIVTGQSVSCGWSEYGLGIDSSEHFQVDCTSNEVMLDVESGAASGSFSNPPSTNTTTPEPGSLFLLGTALLALAWGFRRRLRAGAKRRLPGFPGQATGRGSPRFRCDFRGPELSRRIFGPPPPDSPSPGTLLKPA